MSLDGSGNADWVFRLRKGVFVGNGMVVSGTGGAVLKHLALNALHHPREFCFQGLGCYTRSMNILGPARHLHRCRMKALR